MTIIQAECSSSEEQFEIKINFIFYLVIYFLKTKTNIKFTPTQGTLAEVFTIMHLCN